MQEYDDELARIVAELNRAAPGGGPAEKPERLPQNLGSLDSLLLSAARQNASDLLIVAGYGVCLRVNGNLAPPSGPALSGEETRALVLPLLDARQHEELQRNKSVDFCFVREPVGRFRANIIISGERSQPASGCCPRRFRRWIPFTCLPHLRVLRSGATVSCW